MLPLINRIVVEHDRRDVARLQPLAREIPHKFARPLMRQQTGDLPGQRRPELVFPSEPEQFVIRHRRPKEIGEPRRQCIFVDERMRLPRAQRLDALFAKDKPRRGEHRHHRLGDARLKRRVRQRKHAFRQRHEPLDRGFIGWPAKRPRRESPQNLAGINPSIRQVRRHRAWEKPPVILRRDPVFFRQRSPHRDRVYPHPQLAHLRPVRTDGLDLAGEGVLTRLPVAIKAKREGLPTHPRKLALKAFFAVHGKNQPALVGIELIIDEPLNRTQIKHDFIFSRVRDAVRRRYDDGRVIRKL